MIYKVSFWAFLLLQNNFVSLSELRHPPAHQSKGKLHFLTSSAYRAWHINCLLYELCWQVSLNMCTSVFPLLIYPACEALQVIRKPHVLSQCHFYHHRPCFSSPCSPYQLRRVFPPTHTVCSFFLLYCSWITFHWTQLLQGYGRHLPLDVSSCWQGSLSPSQVTLPCGYVAAEGSDCSRTRKLRCRAHLLATERVGSNLAYPSFPWHAVLMREERGCETLSSLLLPQPWLSWWVFVPFLVFAPISASL